jgi:hypothetical protein
VLLAGKAQITDELPSPPFSSHETGASEAEKNISRATAGVILSNKSI